MAVISLAVLVPVVAGTLLAGIAPFADRRQVLLPVGSAVASLVLAAIVLGRTGDREVVWFSGWHPRDGVAIGIGFAADPLGAGLAVFIATLGIVAIVLAARLITSENLHFDTLMLLFVAAMIGFALTGDLFNMFVFFELMSVAAFVLVGYEVGQRSPLEGALTFAVTNTVGSIVMLFGIGLVYGEAGALNLAQIGRELGSGPAGVVVVVAFALIAVGMLVKAAVVPFHLWAADAYAVAPTPVCILLAGALTELGLYGLFRVYWTAFHGVLGGHEDALRVILVVAGSLTALLGAVMCAAQHHLKRMLAFATIAQVGLFLIGLGLLSADGVAGTAVWVVADGLVKAALFAIVAIVQHRYDRITVGRLHGAARELWPLGILFALGALMIASLPPTGSFLGHSLVEDAALKEHGYAWVPVLMMVVTALIGGTLLRAGARVFAGWGTRAGEDPYGEEREDADTEDEADAPSESGIVLWLPAVLLLAAAAVWGVLPGLVGAAGRAGEGFVDTQGYAAAVLDGKQRAIATPPLEGPGLTAYLYAAGSLAGALGFAAIGLAGAGGRLPRPLAGALDGLRRLHNGRPTDYVAWSVAGAATLCVACAVALT